MMVKPNAHPSKPAVGKLSVLLEGKLHRWNLLLAKGK